MFYVIYFYVISKYKSGLLYEEKCINILKQSTQVRSLTHVRNSD
jgi:hypothetical protein